MSHSEATIQEAERNQTRMSNASIVAKKGISSRTTGRREEERQVKDPDQSKDGGNKGSAKCR